MLTPTLLGVGSTFAKRNLQSNALIEAWAIGPDPAQSRYTNVEGFVSR